LYAIRLSAVSGLFNPSQSHDLTNESFLRQMAKGYEERTSECICKANINMQLSPYTTCPLEINKSSTGYIKKQ